MRWQRETQVRSAIGLANGAGRLIGGALHTTRTLFRKRKKKTSKGLDPLTTGMHDYPLLLACALLIKHDDTTPS
jgi:hypothetical protein